MLNKLHDSHTAELKPFEMRLVRDTWILLCAALIFPTFVRLLVTGAWWVPDFSGYLQTVGMNTMNAAGFASIFFLFLGARPLRPLLLAVSALGFVLEVCYLTLFLPSNLSTLTKALASGAGFAAAGLLGLMAQSYLNSNSAAKGRAAYLLRIALVLMLYPYTMAALMGTLSHLTPIVYDTHAYLLEGSLGFWPSFEVAHYLKLNPGLSAVFRVIYTRLPIWIALALLANIIYSQRCYFNVFTAYILSGVGVVFFYLMIPMVGIDDFLSGQYWPMGPMPQVDPVLVPAGAHLPRTCMPSMHACWILMAYFCVRRISPIFACTFGFLVLTTLISAMRAEIGHYFIDFVPSVPFALAFQAITARSTEGNSSWRMGSLAFGLIATLACALGLRWYGVVLAQSPLFSWSGMGAIVVASLYLEQRLGSVTLDADPQ